MQLFNGDRRIVQRCEIQESTTRLALTRYTWQEPPTSNSFLAKLTNPWKLLLIPLGIQLFIYYFMSKIDPSCRAPCSMLDINFIPPSILVVYSHGLAAEGLNSKVKDMAMASRQLVDSLTTA